MVATIFVRRIELTVSIAGAFARSIGEMPSPSRPQPCVGARARIAHFGGGFEIGIVVAVHEDGRRLEVRGEGEEVLEFVLSPATARFVQAGNLHGPRLELLGED